MNTAFPLALLAALLAGCADQGAAPATEPQAVARAALPPVVTGPINGLYQGRSRQIEATIPGCPFGAYGLVEIGDRTLLFPYTYDLIYAAPVLPDGTLHDAIGETALDGTLVAGRLTFRITTPSCRSLYTLQRKSGF